MSPVELEPSHPQQCCAVGPVGVLRGEVRSACEGSQGLSAPVSGPLSEVGCAAGPEAGREGTRDERGLGTRGLGCGVQGRGCPSEVDPLCLFFVFCPLSSSHASTYVIDMTSSEGMRV